MNHRFCYLAILLSIIGFVFSPAISWGHGVVGQRFFIESESVEDPFASDEMDLIAYSHQKDADGNNANTYSGGISKRLSPNLGIGLEWEYDMISNTDGTSTDGWNNLAAHVKYMMVKIPEHEFLASVMLDWDIGGSGNQRVTEDSHSTLTPSLLFGYGLGDLPDALGVLKPFAVTGQLGIASTLRPHNSDSSTEIDYGLVVQYSLLYLQSFVKDIGIPWPLNRLVPIVEFTGTSPMVGGAELTLYPGIAWAGRFFQVNVEAIAPLNQQSGSGTGVQFLLHLYLDDMFPDTYTWTPFYGVLGGTQK